MKSALLRVLVLFAVPVIVAIAGAEAFLHIFDIANMRAGWRTSHEMDPIHRPPAIVNQLGYRGRPIEIAPGDFVVVLVGDSQVECVACRDGYLPEDNLRDALAGRVGRAVKVVSLGAAAYGADQELLALRTYFRAGYRADLVVVWQTLGNDIFNSMWPNMAPVFGAGKLKPTFQIKPDGQLIEPAGDIGDVLCRYYLSCIYHHQRYGSMDAYFERTFPPPTAPVTSADLPIIDTAESIDHDKTHWLMWVENPSPRVSYGFKLTRALYREMSELAQRNSTKFTLFDVNRHTPIGLAALQYVPFYQPGRKLIRHNGHLFAVGGHDTYAANTAAVNDGFPVIVADMDIPDHCVSPQDGHLNERGNARAMEQLAAKILQQGNAP